MNRHSYLNCVCESEGSPDKALGGYSILHCPWVRLSWIKEITETESKIQWQREKQIGQKSNKFDR